MKRITYFYFVFACSLTGLSLFLLALNLHYFNEEIVIHNLIAGVFYVVAHLKKEK